MSYSTQDWGSKTVVTKTGLINMDNQIAANEQAATAHADRITNIETGTTPAGKANQLKDSRTFTANLASTTPASFNGTGNVSMGVTGVLPVANGGTGSNSIDSTPTKDSTKIVTSGGTYAAIAQNGFGEASGGKNLWNEQWEVGAIGGADGKNASNTNMIRSIGYIEVNPSTTYNFVLGSISGDGNLFFYDSNKGYISGSYNKSGGTFTTPSNATYVRFSSGTAYGNSYHNDILIGISGTYEPFYASNKILTDAVNGLSDSISDAWDASKTYAVGSYCLYMNTLYKCLIQNSNQNPASSPTYWKKCKVTDILNIGTDYTNATVLYNDAIEAGSFYQYIAEDDGVIHIVQMYGNVTGLTSTGMPYVNVTINYITMFTTQGFVANNARASGASFRVKKGDVFRLYVQNQKLNNVVIKFAR